MLLSIAIYICQNASHFDKKLNTEIILLLIKICFKLTLKHQLCVLILALQQPVSLTSMTTPCQLYWTNMHHFRLEQSRFGPKFHGSMVISIWLSRKDGNWREDGDSHVSSRYIQRAETCAPTSINSYLMPSQGSGRGLAVRVLDSGL